MNEPIEPDTIAYHLGFIIYCLREIAMDKINERQRHHVRAGMVAAVRIEQLIGIERDTND